MESLLLSFNVVFPLFCMMGLGYILKRLGVLDTHTTKHMNSAVFRVFIPLTLFVNVYGADIRKLFSGRFVFFAVSAVVVMFIFSAITIPIIEKNPARRSVMMQAMFRSNFVLFGIPVSSAIFGDSALGTIALLIAIIVPIFNILSVIALQYYSGNKISFNKLLLEVAKNPIVQAAIVAIAFSLFDIKLPVVITKTIGDLAKVATPLALVLLGTNFSAGAVKKHFKNIIIGSVTKLCLFPLFVIPTAIFFGFKDVELIALATMAGAPLAVSTYTMSQEMNADFELAGLLVAFTSCFSILTIFIIVYTLSTFGFIDTRFLI